jgi:hypothetical protein
VPFGKLLRRGWARAATAAGRTTPGRVRWCDRIESHRKRHLDGGRVFLIVVGAMVSVGITGTGTDSGAGGSPAGERAFLQIVETGRKAVEGDNEVRIAEARKQRATDMCNALPKSLGVSV